MKTYYKAFKLKNGELMAGMTEDDITLMNVRNTYAIKVINPVVFNSFKFLDNDGELVETVSMMPMIPVTDDVTLEVASDHIFSVTTMRESAVERYTIFLEHLALQQAAEEKEESEEDQAQQDEFSTLNVNDLDNKILH